MLLSSAAVATQRLLRRRSSSTTPLLLRRRGLSSTANNDSDHSKPLVVTHEPVAGGAPGAVIATLAMNRPKARNALSRALVAEVRARRAAADAVCSV